MNGTTHELVTRKAIELMDSLESGMTVGGYNLKAVADNIAKNNSNTDHIKDLELVDVEGCYNTGRDNPHKSESDQIDDKPHYKETRFGLDMDLTAMNHFIDIRKGKGAFDDYDGYSYQSAKKDQHEKEENTGKYLDDLINWWYNDEYVHAPGQEYYQNCSPSVWNYSFPGNKGIYADKFAELKARFPLAEYQGKSGKGIPYSVFMPVDNLGRYWYETFLLGGNMAECLGYVLHAIQDAAVPHHAAGYMGNYHRDYENKFDAYAQTYVTTSAFRKNAAAKYNEWKNVTTTVNSLEYAADYNTTPGINWRVDHLITWLAFRAYREFSTTYAGFANFKALNNASAEKLLDLSCAMSMLLLKKAQLEYQKLYPSNANRVKNITVRVTTRNASDADTDSNIALYISGNGFAGGALEMVFKDIANYDDFERGRTDTYTFDVSSRSINAANMKLAVGLLGRDNWQPEKFTITYTTWDGKEYTYANSLTFDQWLTSTHHYHEIPRSTVKNVVSGIRIAAYGSASSARNSFASDYTVIDRDLNKGSGGKYIYLGYKTSALGSCSPITNLILINSSKSQSWSSKEYTINGITSTYYRIDVDLNKGSGGKYIYLCYTCDKAYAPLLGLDVAFGGETIAAYWEVVKWAGTNDNADVNKGSGGKYIYILQRRN